MLTIGKLRIIFFEEWRQFFTHCNWYTLDLIQLSVERADYAGRYEANIVILGLGVCITYTYDDTFEKKMERRVQEIENGTAKLYTVEEALEELRKGL